MRPAPVFELHSEITLLTLAELAETWEAKGKPKVEVLIYY
jgi:hypothetical protein